MDYFRRKCVLVTGGSSGIGLAAARQLRVLGADLVVVARNVERLDAARAALEAIPAAGGSVETLSLDVSDGAAVDTALPALLERRPVHMLVSCAGIVMPGHFLELPEAQFDDMLQTNLMGAVRLTRLLLPPMIARGSGHLAYVNSLAGLVGIYGYAAYSASKFALRGFAQVLRCEMRPNGIRVTVCYPPDTDTPQLAFENRYKPAETRAIAGNVKPMTADAVAARLLKGMAGDKFQVVPNGSARFTDLSYRLFPGLVHTIIDGDVRKVAAHAKRTRVP